VSVGHASREISSAFGERFLGFVPQSGTPSLSYARDRLGTTGWETN
jgi:hypothetical protein